MSLTKTDVIKVAHLARLAMDTNLIERYATELSNILNFVAQMDAVNTDNIQPMAHPLDLHQPCRPDIVTEKNERERFQSIAPKVEAGLYLVPQVIE